MSDQTGHGGEKSLLVDSRQDPGQGTACPGDSATYHLGWGPGKSGSFLEDGPSPTPGLFTKSEPRFKFSTPLSSCISLFVCCVSMNLCLPECVCLFLTEGFGSVFTTQKAPKVEGMGNTHRNL